MTARDRIWPSVIGIIVFTALGSLADPKFWNETWFFVGLGVALSATFVEPHFVKPQDVIVNTAGALGALLAFRGESFGLLWLSLLTGVVTVGVASGVAALVRNDGSAVKVMAYRIATRLGKSVVL